MPTKRERIYAKTGGRCIYCGGTLPAKGWHADHFLPVQREGGFQRGEGGRYSWQLTGEVLHPRRDTERNLVPACASCNIDKGSNSVEWWRRSIERTTTTLQDARAYRFACRFGLVEETGADVRFWFETDEGQAALPEDVRAMIADALRRDDYYGGEPLFND